MKRRIQGKVEKLFQYIVSYQEENGFPPSLREMGVYMGISSTSTVSYYLTYLEELGLIRRDVYKNRAIEILTRRKNEGKEAYERRRRLDTALSSVKLDQGMKGYTPIPVLGSITAGQPILAVEDPEDLYYLPRNMFSGGNLFMLNVQGDSMIEAGILNGDMAIINRQDTANNGEIVAVLIGDHATIKRFYKEDGRYRLQPENSTMEPMYFNEVSIIGKVVGIIRNM